MGKKEMEPMPIKYLIAIVFLIMLGIVMYLFAFSVPLNHLEAKITEKADFKVSEIDQADYPTNGGHTVLATDKANHGYIQVYAKIPIMNRFMRTDEFAFSIDEEAIIFTAKEWSKTSAFTVENGQVTRSGSGVGWGYSGEVLFFFLWMEGFIIATTLIRNDVIKTRKEKAANPVKNY